MKTLDKLLVSRPKKKILRYFMDTDDRKSSRELQKIIKEDSGNVQKAANEFVRYGILDKEDGKYFAKNKTLLKLLQQVDDCE